MNIIKNDIEKMIPSAAQVEEKKIWELLETVCDPEIPVLSILDLGIVRSVKFTNDNDGQPAVKITITPTYSGCPAMDMISMQIRMLLLETGYKNITIESVLSPAWTTDWMTTEGKEKLRSYGIAPPHLTNNEAAIACPQCKSTNTKLLSQFGSTACKALYQCQDCLEPFDYFKCH
ncbi:MAG: 1,2-phenylacetyl-CoA epoxidase subunit PaaD [Ferruginibacter sp.]